MSRNLEERERETTTMAPAMQKKACTGGVWFLAASQLLGFGKAIIIRGGAGCRFSPAHIWTITLGKEESTHIGKTRSRKTGFYVHLCEKENSADGTFNFILLSPTHSG